MIVEIWADVVCPWCWIGEARLARAIAAAGAQDDTRIEMRAFRLDPDPDPPRVPTVERLQRKYGWTEADTLARMAQIAELGSELGLPLHPERAISAPSTDALRLVLAARPAGMDVAVMTALHRAHFTDALDIGDHNVLRAAATGAGLDRPLTDEVLGSDRHADEVEADEHEARAFGVQGVPFTVFDRRLAVSGAQAQEVFDEAVRRALAG
ncbi:DsbA family oxidoreductase [Svornostia abyssi]|uniref:DsbA family oxidoreductase n=1 Tax=Svornostia abyssi TaxID=2898438 RepID=A0ABY5PDR6_9ACTN|nr:DsbA family oxidoreductase [Parviterribacteraceae bacterium J379]